MIAGGRFLCALAVAALIVPASGETAGVTATAGPLTNEDIVRMVAAGTAESAIVAAIAARDETFDVSDDMVDELTLAGVSAPILAAMKRRHGQNAPVAPPKDRPALSRLPLIVTLSTRVAGFRTLKAPAFADEDLKTRLLLPKDNDRRAVKDLAIFLACESPEHIPDLWRSKTPLGRDMVSVVRHQMLAFVPGESPQGSAPRLAVPARIEADVDGTEPHDIVLGLAALIGDRWMQLASARASKVTTSVGSKPLIGRVDHVGNGFEFKVELAAPP